MSLLPALAIWQFALAGVACAAVPILLHFLNRRRFRRVEWAAMQFLREAMRRQRRIMQVRDLLLMLLRAAAVTLFGCALARPFFITRQEQQDAGQPIHAVLLIDNSLSMGFQTLDGTLLDRAKRRAAAWIDRLPVGSRISVLPLGGSEVSVNREPFDSKPFALEALQRVTLVDRSVRFGQAVHVAQREAESANDLARRYVLFSDQQRIHWTSLAALNQDQQLPAMQLVDVSDPEWDNSWVADLQIPDGVADTETPTTIQAVLRHHGREPRGNVRVSLWVRGQEVDSQFVSFDAADSTREVIFETIFRDAHPEASRADYVPIQVVLAPDRLVEDDVRHLLVPVVAVLPVVFVDQYGADEDPARNRFGETRHLRQLLAPAIARVDAARQLIQVRHRRIGELDRETLADARLVVIAGVEDPGEQIPLLREYVEQGGQLVLAAGAGFDPVAWNAAGWRDGKGVLPLPLLPDLLGSLPEAAAADLRPLSLSFESLGQHPYFHLVGNSEDDLRDLYAEPFFFQAVQVDLSPDAFAVAAKSSATPVDDSSSPWLFWSPHADLHRDARPQVLARFTNETGPAYLVDRSIGRGRVLFAASGVLSSWNTLPKTNAIVMFDRILRSMMRGTLPARNFGSVEQIAVPIPNDAREDHIVLSRPGQGTLSESLDTGFLRTDQVGVTIYHPLTRGIYRLQAIDSQSTLAGETAAPPRWQLELSVNGDESESDLERLSRDSFAQQVVSQQVHWIDANEEISLSGTPLGGQELWWWLILATISLLLLEFVIIAWTH